MALRLAYRAETPIPVELEGIVPSALAGKPLGRIERIELFHGNRRRPLAEFFRVSGRPDDGRIRFEGDLSGVHWIGAGMDGGEIHVEGSAGRHLGSEMTSGRITVAGDVGDWAGAELHGGTIHVRGSAGHLVGAAYRGSRRGMTGGTILVEGPAGNEIAYGMRRGLVAVGGAADAVGFNLLAGTVMVFGPCGIRPGADMRRGTIALLGEQLPVLLPSFRHACRLRPAFMELLLGELARLGYARSAATAARVYDLYHGDLVSLGRGEILLPGG